MEIAVNTFGMGKQLGNDFSHTVGELLSHGITGMEPCILFLGNGDLLEKTLTKGKSAINKLGGVWLPEEAEEKIRTAREAGLSIEGAHLFDKDLTEKSILKAAEFAAQNGLSYYVLSYMDDKVANVAKYIPVLRSACRTFREYGVRLMIHNHSVDLKETEGLCVYDFLLDNVPGLEVQLDLGWVHNAGWDCVETMEKYRDRIRLLHFKDIWPGGAAGKLRFSAVGEGSIPLAEIMKKAQELDLIAPGYIIDQDNSEGNLMEDIFTGAAHIRDGVRYTPETRLHWEEKVPLSMMSFTLAFDLLKRRKLSLDDLCAMLSDRGINCIDMMELELLLYGKRNVRSALRKYGISLECLIATVPMGTMKAPVIRMLVKKHLKTAAAFGCRRLMLIPMPQTDPFPKEEPARTERLNRCVRFMKEAVEEAKKYDITVCVEDTPTCEVPLSSIKDCRDFLEAVPGLRLVFDTANMIPCGDDPMEFYKELKQYICHVHLKDVRYTTEKTVDHCEDGRYIECCPWGEGIIPVKELYEQLKEDGYSGACAIEYVPPKQDGAIANDHQINYFLNYLSK